MEHKTEKREITEELRESYIDYAMSVIVSRALPDVRDGMKPVQRRILWSMWESGLRASARHRKSAAVVGEVLKSYHPHGDAPVYDALARMAQGFSLRYPLVNGQGNWGSVDGDPPAAMRYTECKLSKIAEEMMTDIEKETVGWKDNYDNTQKEPLVLPARIPHLLLNGSMGIAVGMATSIPPHNLGEVVDAAVYLVDNPRATTEDLAEIVRGPDFPTGGIIYDKKQIREAYAAGRGSITCRAAAEIEERKGGQFAIVITEIPYQVNKAELVTKMAALAQDRKIEGIRDIRDESDREGMRIVLELKQEVSPQKVLNQLYKHTDLQKDFHLNMLALVDGIQPQVLSLEEVLRHYLEHRKEVVKRRAEFDLKKAEERAHILEGLSKALDHIDEVISTIKKSEDKEDAKKNLVKKFDFTDIQADAILEMKLQTLAALERQKIDDELKEKKGLIKELGLLLKSPEKMLAVVKDELAKVKDAYADERRTKVVAGGLKDFAEEDLVQKEDVVITLSGGGYIKRMSHATFKAQKRGGKGLIGSNVSEEDFLSHFISANTHDYVLFFTNKGRVFQTKGYEIPAGTRIAKGKLIQNFLDIPQNEHVTALLNYPQNAKKEGLSIFMTTRNGVVKKTNLSEFDNLRRSGIIAIGLVGDDELRWAHLIAPRGEVMLTTCKGQAIRFKGADVRTMGRTASGVRGIALKPGDFVSGMDIIGEERPEGVGAPKVLVITERGLGKQTPLTSYKVQRRGGSGIKTARISPKTGEVIATKILTNETEILALSSKGQMIRTYIKGIRTAGRDTSGVKIMNVEPGDKVIDAVCI